MQKLIEAVGTLRVSQLAKVEVDRALEDLIKIALRQQQALRFYADRSNYIDGVPMVKDNRGMLVADDEGSVARYALGEDRHGPALLVLQERAA